MTTNRDKVRPAPELAIGDDAVVEDINLDDTEVIVDGERLTEERADEIAADVLAKARAHSAGQCVRSRTGSSGTATSSTSTDTASSAASK